MANRKEMSVAEFRRLGYLQELNRRFLHPLGLSLEVDLDVDNCTESFSAVWDCRDYLEGITLGIGQCPNPSLLADHIIKKKKIDDEIEIRSDARKEAFGYVIEPVPHSADKLKG